jgi:RNA polymerase sigma factor (sigma-70 family)
MSDSRTIPPPTRESVVLRSHDLARVREAEARGRSTYPHLRALAAPLERRVATLAARHWRGQGLDPTPERVSAYVHGAALEDLYLTTACEEGSEPAWGTLSDAYRSRLEGFAVRRGLCGADAEAAAQDLLGDLAAPPPRPGNRTLIGTFDATGSLFGWLCIVLARRIAARARLRRVERLEDDAADAQGSTRPTRAALDPASVVAQREAEAGFERALVSAWESLSGQERLALVAKHRDGLTQRDVGRMLGVGEARVSRVVGSAVAKLSDALKAGVEAGAATDAPPAGALWARLEAAVARHLASRAPLDAPSSGASPGGGPASGDCAGGPK